MTGALPDLSPFFERYEAQAREADALFAHVRAGYPDLVVCREQCSDCCHALFDLSLVEALYINRAFSRRFAEGTERFALINKASAVDRRIARIKRKAFQDSKAGRDSNEILTEMATVKTRCPLLDDDDRCLLYEFRPITCRLYGAPTSIGGKAHTCGRTGFVQGRSYPTVALDKIQHRLNALSAELAASIGSRYSELALMYVPVSTALITAYDAAYLGVGGIAREKDG